MIKKISNLVNNKDLQIEKIYLFLITFFIFITLFIDIPADRTSIGISASVLDIGDRIFYINDSARGFGYDDYSGNIIYPLILKGIKFIASIFGQDQYSKLWNFLIIFITSSLSIISLKLLKISSSNLFNQKVSNIASILFVLNPYTYFYSLSGGITNFVIVGVSFILYFFSRRKITKGILNQNNKKDTFFVISICFYLSLLRPSGGIFGFIILTFLLWENVKTFVHNQEYKEGKKIEAFLIIVGIFLVSYNLTSTLDYSVDTFKLFSDEGGQFFGYPRDSLKDKLTTQTNNIFTNLKHTLYFLVWKVTDFVSGLSDIRDTHSQFMNQEKVLPFIFRTFTGIFILFPLNLFSLLGILSNLKFIKKSQIWVVLIAGFIAVSPSLLGFSMSRYLMMFYPPFLVFSAKMIHDTFLGIKESKI